MQFYIKPPSAGSLIQAKRNKQEASKSQVNLTSNHKTSQTSIKPPNSRAKTSTCRLN